MNNSEKKTGTFIENGFIMKYTDLPVPQRMS